MGPSATHLRPLMDDFFRWVRAERDTTPGRNLATKALGYALNQEAELRRVLDDSDRSGPRSIEAAHPEVWPTLEKLVDPVTRGDPESPLRWTCKSTHVLADEVFAQHGIQISHKTTRR